MSVVSMRPAQRAQCGVPRNVGNIPVLACQDVLQGTIRSMQTIHQQSPLHSIVYAKSSPFIERPLDRSNVQGIARTFPVDLSLIDRG